MQKNQSIAKCLFSNQIFLNDLESIVWHKSEAVYLTKLWSGRKAEISRQAEVRLLWNKKSLFVRFEANQTEPLIINSTIDKTRKAIDLWEKDVCEIFVAPNTVEPEKYFEFEVAPTGEWVDLAIIWSPEKRETDWNYQSNMKVAVKIFEDKIISAMEIPFAAFGKVPRAGDIWLGNMFRCIGEGETRGYLAWQPTFTEVPNFHVPSAFGKIEFAV
jgi:alpha-galactosidase